MVKYKVKIKKTGELFIACKEGVKYGIKYRGLFSAEELEFLEEIKDPEDALRDNLTVIKEQIRKDMDPFVVQVSKIVNRVFNGITKLF